MDQELQYNQEENTSFIRFSLRSKLLYLLLGVTILIVATLGYLSFDAVSRMGETARVASSEALLTQIEELLVELTVVNARENALILDKTLADAKNVAEYANFVFSQPDVFAPQANWSVEEFMFFGPEGQYMNGPEDVSTVIIPNTVTIDDKLLDTLELTTILDNIFIPTYEQDKNTVAIWTANNQEITRYYPNIVLGEIVPGDFIVTEEIFYTIALPENNPDGETIWSAVYDDPAGQGLLVSAIAPIYRDDEFFGVIGIDFSLNNLAINIEASELAGDSYSFLIDESGRAIALPEQAYLDLLGRPAEAGEFGADMNMVSDAVQPIIADMKAGGTGFANVTVNDRDLFVAYASLGEIGWSLGTVIEADSVLQLISPLQSQLANETNNLIFGRFLPISVVVLLAVLVLGLWITYQLVNPLQQLTVATQKIGAQQWDTPLPQGGNDEVGVLARTIRGMANQLEGMFGTLESQIANRTHRLAIIAALSEHLTSILDRDVLLEEVVNQIKTNFNYYHVHIYLLDQQNNNLVVQAGTGPAGAEMVAHGHYIPLFAPTSLVARAARSSELVRVDNVREAPDWLPNELLPDTYAEMAVPIVLDRSIVGVLDVQQDRISGFNEGDENVLRTLANQVAIAVRNARLFEEVEQRLANLQELQERYTQKAWEQTILADQYNEYDFYRPALTSLSADVLARAEEEALQRDQPAIVQLSSNGSPTSDAEQTSLVAPVKLGDQVIGSLQLHQVNETGQSGSNWSENELAFVQSILDQVALSAENLRLFDKTQERASREATIRDITDKLRAANDLDELMKITVEVVGERFSATYAELDVDLNLAISPDKITIKDPNSRG